MHRDQETKNPLLNSAPKHQEGNALSSNSLEDPSPFPTSEAADLVRLAEVNIELAKKEHLVAELENKIEILESERTVNIQKIHRLSQALKEYSKTEEKRRTTKETLSLSFGDKNSNAKAQRFKTQETPSQNPQDKINTKSDELREKVTKLAEKQNLLEKELNEKVATIRNLETEVLKQYDLLKGRNTDSAIQKHLKEQIQYLSLLIEQEMLKNQILTRETTVNEKFQNTHSYYSQNLEEQIKVLEDNDLKKQAEFENAKINWAKEYLDLQGLLTIDNQQLAALVDSTKKESEQTLLEKNKEIAASRKALQKCQEEIERLQEQVAVGKTQCEQNLSNTTAVFGQKQHELQGLLDVSAAAQNKLLNENEQLAALVDNSKQQLEQTTLEKNKKILALQTKIEQLNQQALQEKAHYEQNLSKTTAILAQKQLDLQELLDVYTARQNQLLNEKEQLAALVDSSGRNYEQTLVEKNNEIASSRKALEKYQEEIGRLHDQVAEEKTLYEQNLSNATETLTQENLVLQELVDTTTRTQNEILEKQEQLTALVNDSEINLEQTTREKDEKILALQTKIEQLNQQVLQEKAHYEQNLSKTTQALAQKQLDLQELLDVYTARQNQLLNEKEQLAALVDSSGRNFEQTLLENNNEIASSRKALQKCQEEIGRLHDQVAEEKTLYEQNLSNATETLTQENLVLQELVDTTTRTQNEILEKQEQLMALVNDSEINLEQTTHEKDEKILVLQTEIEQFNQQALQEKAHYEQNLSKTTQALAQKQLDLQELLNVYTARQNQLLNEKEQLAALVDSSGKSFEQTLLKKNDEIASSRKALEKYQEEIGRLHDQVAEEKTLHEQNLSNATETLTQENLVLQELVDTTTRTQNEILEKQEQLTALVNDSEINLKQTTHEKDEKILALQTEIEQFNQQALQEKAHYEQNLSNTTQALAQKQLDLQELLDVYTARQNQLLNEKEQLAALVDSSGRNFEQTLLENNNEIASSRKVLEKCQEEIGRLHDQVAEEKTLHEQNLSNATETLTRENLALQELVDTYTRTQNEILEKQEQLTAFVNDSEINLEQTTREKDEKILALQTEIEQFNQQTLQEKTLYEQNLSNTTQALAQKQLDLQELLDVYTARQNQLLNEKEQLAALVDSSGQNFKQTLVEKNNEIASSRRALQTCQEEIGRLNMEITEKKALYEQNLLGSAKDFELVTQQKNDEISKMKKDLENYQEKIERLKTQVVYLTEGQAKDTEARVVEKDKKINELQEDKDHLTLQLQKQIAATRDLQNEIKSNWAKNEDRLQRAKELQNKIRELNRDPRNRQIQ